MPKPENLKHIVLATTREITKASAALGVLVASFADRPTPADLDRLAADVELLQGCLREFRKGCEQAARTNSFVWE